MKLKMTEFSGIIDSDDVTLITFNYLKNDNNMHLSQLKVKSNGYPLLFSYLEYELTLLGINTLKIEITYHDKYLINVLLDLGYIIKSSDSREIILLKKISKKKSWRISLTENCNYDCFFCHGEGLDLQKVRNIHRSTEEMYELIKTGIGLGYTDITFTGGEPLIKYKEIIELIAMLINDELFPDLTIVTNGYLINDALLHTLSTYPGNVKLNLSIHSINKDFFYQITRPKASRNNVFETVVANIEKIQNYPTIKLKMNFVILKDINNSETDIQKIIDFGIKYNATAIKFIELLITKEHHDLYDYFYQIEGVANILPSGFELVRKELRRDVYKRQNYDILIELQKCSCEFGCSKCLLTRDVLITSELEHFPCFLLSDRSIPVKKDVLADVIKEGDNQIKKFAEVYGNSNPLLISETPYVIEKIEYYYSVNGIDFGETQAIVEKCGFNLKRKRDFQEMYYVVDSKEETLKVLKLFSNSYNKQKYTEIRQEITLAESNGFFSTVRYINDKKPEVINNISKYESDLAFLGFSRKFQLEWKTLLYKRNSDFISVGFNVETSSIILMTNQRLEPDLQANLKSENINMFLLDYLHKK